MCSTRLTKLARFAPLDVLVLGIPLMAFATEWYARHERWTIEFHLGFVFLVASMLLVSVAIRKEVAMAGESRPA